MDRDCHNGRPTMAESYFAFHKATAESLNGVLCPRVKNEKQETGRQVKRKCDPTSVCVVSDDNILASSPMDAVSFIIQQHTGSPTCTIEQAYSILGLLQGAPKGMVWRRYIIWVKLLQVPHFMASKRNSAFAELAEKASKMLHEAYQSLLEDRQTYPTYAVAGRSSIDLSGDT